ELVRDERVPRVKVALYVRIRREAHAGLAPHVLGGDDRRRRRADLAAQRVEARLPRVFVAVQLAIAAIVDVRELYVRALRQREANAAGISEAAVEIVLERIRFIALLREARQWRQRQTFVVDRQPAAHRPAAPSEEIGRASW